MQWGGQREPCCRSTRVCSGYAWCYVMRIRHRNVEPKPKAQVSSALHTSYCSKGSGVLGDMQWSWLILSCSDLYVLFAHIPSLTVPGLHSGECHSPGHGRLGPCGPWHSAIWSSTQQRRTWDALWRWISNRTPCRAMEPQSWIWQSQEDLEENLGHELGDCVLRTSREQMWFGGWNLWGWVALSLLNCGFLFVAMDFCWLPLLSSHLHNMRVNPTGQVGSSSSLCTYYFASCNICVTFPLYLITIFPVVL
jgi:hypothetical protein